MKNMATAKIVVSMVVLAVLSSGCGYTTSSLLPENYKAICVDNFKNDIKISAEQTNLRMYRGYRPGMETELTKAIIDKFLFDGNLKIAQESNADIILKGALLDYKRDTIRYGADDVTEEYRIKLIIDMELIDAKTGETVWAEKAFAGETTYRTGGTLAKSEDEAIRDAIKDLARRVVDRTIEAW